MRLTALWWWIDRWRKSSAFMDMTLEEQGAYRNLLDEAHLRGGPLPLDERILAKACGDALAWPKVRTAVLARFEKQADGWHNTTLEEVLAQSVRRATNQANYRNRNNGHDNGTGNKSDNKPDSPDPSPSLLSGSGSGSVSGEKQKNSNSSVNSRSRRPIFQGQRFVIFDWMLEDLSRILGSHIDDFDVHSWFFDIDARAVKEGLVKAKNDWWPWVQSEIVLEAGRRGLPVGETELALSDQGKKNRVAAHAALARIQGGRK